MGLDIVLDAHAYFHAQKKGGSSVPGLGLALDSDAQPSGAGKGDEPLLMVYEAGSVPYGDSLAWQRRLQSQVLSGTHPHTLLMLEHDPPVYTLGRRASVDHIVGNVVEGERLSQRGVACADDTMVGTIEAPGMERADIHRIERGGEVTWHGPGQLVGYSIVDLGAAGMKKDLHWYLRQIEEVVIRSLAELHIEATRHPEYTGVWVDHDGPAKIAAVGLSVSKQVGYDARFCNQRTTAIGRV